MTIRDRAAAELVRREAAAARLKVLADEQRQVDEAKWCDPIRFKHEIDQLFGKDAGTWTVTGSTEDSQTLVDQETNLKIKIVRTGESVADYGWVDTTRVLATDVPADLRYSGMVSERLRLRDLIDVARAFEYLDKKAVKA